MALTFFNDSDIEITEDVFPSAIYERTKENPHESLTAPCEPFTGSLDEYAGQFLDELFPALGV